MFNFFIELFTQKELSLSKKLVKIHPHRHQINTIHSNANLFPPILLSYSSLCQLRNNYLPVLVVLPLIRLCCFDCAFVQISLHFVTVCHTLTNNHHTI